MRVGNRKHHMKELKMTHFLIINKQKNNATCIVFFTDWQMLRWHALGPWFDLSTNVYKHLCTSFLIVNGMLILLSTSSKSICCFLQESLNPLTPLWGKSYFFKSHYLAKLNKLFEWHRTKIHWKIQVNWRRQNLFTRKFGKWNGTRKSDSGCAKSYHVLGDNTSNCSRAEIAEWESTFIQRQVPWEGRVYCKILLPYNLQRSKSENRKKWSPLF